MIGEERRKRDKGRHEEARLIHVPLTLPPSGPRLEPEVKRRDGPRHEVEG